MEGEDKKKGEKIPFQLFLFSLVSIEQEEFEPGQKEGHLFAIPE